MSSEEKGTDLVGQKWGPGEPSRLPRKSGLRGGTCQGVVRDAEQGALFIVIPMLSEDK